MTASATFRFFNFQFSIFNFPSAPFWARRSGGRSVFLVERHRLLAGVVVETGSRLVAAEASGQHHLAGQRRGGEALLLVLLLHHVRDVVSRIEADEVEERERSHRVTAAEDHGL